MDKAAKAKFSTILLGCVALYLGSSGFSELGGDLAEVKNAAESVNWPSADAVITNSIFSTIKRGKHTTNYGAELAYNYTVDGAPMSGMKSAFFEALDRNETEEKAQAILKHYPKGSHHKVFYSPNNKKQAVLVPGVDKSDVRFGSILKLSSTVMLILLAVINYFALKFPRTVTNRLITFFCSFVVCVIAFFVSDKINDSVVASNVPVQSALRVEEDGYYLGEKKFEY